MPKKKILLFSDWFYPGFMAGGPIQSSFNMLNHLKEFYDFSVVTRDTDYTATTPYKNIINDSWNILPNGMRVYYFSKKNLSYANMSKLIHSEEFDVAYLNSMYSPRFTIMPLFILHKMGKKVIIAPRGMLAPTAIAIKSWKKKPFLLWLKNSKMLKVIIFHAASEQEAKHTKMTFGDRAEIRIAPNLPGKLELPPPVWKPKSPDYVHLINVARVSPEKNLLYALKVMENVKGKVKFDIYGPVYDIAYWEKCKEALTKLPANIKAKYLGPINKVNIPDAMREAHFLLMPTQGENFGHIILEAMMGGCPPIISDKTPWRGLEPIKAGFDISLENPEKFEGAINQTVAMEQEEFNTWSDTTRSHVLEFMSKPELIQQSINIFN